MRAFLSVLVLAAVVAPSAFACVNGMRMEDRKSADLVARANTAYREGSFAKALLTAEAALDRPGLSEAERRGLLRVKGLAGIKTGEFDKAISALKSLSELRMEPFIEVKLAEAQLRKGDSSGATDGVAAARLEKLANDNLLSDADAWTALARARARLGNVEGAKAACEAALKVQPGHPEATTLLGTLGTVTPKPPSAEPVKPAAKS